MAKRIENIADLRPDPDNANQGTMRGAVQIENSLREYGAGRSIVVDTNGITIAGAKTLESAADIGLPIEVVRTDGTKLVVVQRTDLDLNGDGKARMLAYADNRAGEVRLEWNPEQIAADLGAGVELGEIFRKDELDEILADLGSGEPEEPPEPQTDRADELQQKWGTERGQVWEIGRHRLMCGDAEINLDGFASGTYELMLTDPPYGISVVQSAQVGGGGPTKFGKVGGGKDCTVEHI